MAACGHNASLLELLGSSDVPTPRVIDVDATGDTCDVPAVLSIRLIGDVDLDVPLQALADTFCDVPLCVSVPAPESGNGLHRQAEPGYEAVLVLPQPDDPFLRVYPIEGIGLA